MNSNSSCTGEFRHRWGDRVRNHIKGGDRLALREKLKHRTAAVIANELNQEAQIDTVRCGNANGIYKTKLLTQIRHEV